MVEIKDKDGAVLRNTGFLIPAVYSLHEGNPRWVILSGADLHGAHPRWANLGDKEYVCLIIASRSYIVAVDDDVRIGCLHKPLAEWLETFEAVGRENGYSEAEIAEYGGWLRQIAAVLAARRGEVAG